MLNGPTLDAPQEDSSVAIRGFAVVVLKHCSTAVILTFVYSFVLLHMLAEKADGVLHKVI